MPIATRSRRLPLAAGLLVLAGLAACGGDGSGSSSATSTAGSTSGSTAGSSGSPSTTGSSSGVASVSVSPASNTVDLGGAYRLTATPRDGTGQAFAGRSVAWSTSSSTVATVETDGTVTARAAGTATLTATVDGRTASATVTVVDPATASVRVQVDGTAAAGAVRDLLGVNKPPRANGQTPGVTWDGRALYSAFGVSQVRLHDAGADLCVIYTAAVKLNVGVSPATAVSGCTLSGTGGPPHFSWTPSSSADNDLDNPDHYDFSRIDQAILDAQAAGARIYLRLGESYNGPNDTADPVAWAKVATNIYRHVIGVFKPTAGIAVDPAYVEVHNEPDGMFWRGTPSDFHTLYNETTSRVRAAAAAAGRTVKVGGAGFTRNVLDNAQRPGNVANGFFNGVSPSTLDFYSAHLYENCANATLSGAAGHLRALRSMLNSAASPSLPMHVTEWNIGLGSDCGNSLFGEPRMQSFASGVLTLMQDPALGIEAAHFYTGMPIMALFDFSSVSGSVRVNPSAWAFWAHQKLKDHERVSAQVCPNAGACVDGIGADTAPVVAIAARSGSGSAAVQRALVTNHGASAVTTTVRFGSLAGSSTASISILSPPGVARDIAAPGQPVSPTTDTINALLAEAATQSRSALVVQGGQVQVTITVPAWGLQLVELRTP